jgi:hypothetical protein
MPMLVRGSEEKKVEVVIIVHTKNVRVSVTKRKQKGPIQQYISVSSVQWRRSDPFGFVIQPRR